MPQRTLSRHELMLFFNEGADDTAEEGEEGAPRPPLVPDLGQLLD